MKLITKIQKNKYDIIDEAKKYAIAPYTLFFDSNRPEHPDNKWSFLCFSPTEVISSKNGIITHNGKNIGAHDAFDFLQSRLDNYDFECDSHIPFTGGIAGYWGYDLGRSLEEIPDKTKDDLDLPDLVVGIYTALIAHDHENNETWFIRSVPEEFNNFTIPHHYISINNWHENPTATVEEQKNASDYKTDIQKIIDYIYAGEIYQANMSRRFDIKLPDDFCTLSHYLHLREINSAPFSAYMNLEDFQLSSCSPERFLKLQNGIVETKPIKGTLPADQNSDILLNSEKDRAENLMIVDLLRNDISKTCKPHSVKVPKLCEIETFEGLHHLVSTVTGEIKPKETALSLLKSCFPGGSITGAPKIRAMQIIEELEETRRGPYCGAMGYIGFSGNMDTNIVIRTLIYKDGKAHLQTGSGIVSDSDPSQELFEGLKKAEKIFESFGLNTSELRTQELEK